MCHISLELPPSPWPYRVNYTINAFELNFDSFSFHIDDKVPPLHDFETTPKGISVPYPLKHPPRPHVIS